VRKTPNGVFTNAEAAKTGLRRQQLAVLAKEGKVTRISRGVYTQCESSSLSQLEMIVLAKRGTDCIIALESALVLHGFTTATPHALWIAMRRGARKPATDFPIEIIRVSDPAYFDRIEEHDVNGVSVRVYSAAKTVADLFKFRNKTGLSLALEALHEGLRKQLFTVDELMAAAKIDRVNNLILPYVQGALG